MTFDAGDGIDSQSVTVNMGGKIARPADPDREGYVFLGWFVRNEEFDFNSPIGTDITLTAKWRALVRSISVTTPPSNIEYIVGEKLDLSGMVITATYSDGRNDDAAGYSTEPKEGEALNEVGTVAVTISYTNEGLTKTTSFNVTVKPALFGIAITTPPAKTLYVVGEALDLSGVVVNAVYSDDSTKTVTGYTTIPAAGAVLNTTGTQTVKVAYTEDGITKTAEFTVTVAAEFNVTLDFHEGEIA